MPGRAVPHGTWKTKWLSLLFCSFYTNWTHEQVSESKPASSPNHTHGINATAGRKTLLSKVKVWLADWGVETVT